MSQIPRSKTGQLTKLLRQRLNSGDWSGQLPPERALADEYFVSRTTLRQALATLTDEGIIKAATSTRSGRKLTTPSIKRDTAQATQAIVLTPSLTGSPLLLEQLAILRERLGPTGTQVHVQEAAALAGQEDPRYTLQRLINRRPEAIWVLHRMPMPVQRFFSNGKPPAMVFGSTFPDITLPGIDVDFHAAARHAAGLCLSRGLEHVTLLLHRTHLAGDARTIAAVTEQLERKGAPPPRILRHDFNRSRLMDRLDQAIVSRHTPCDALLISNQHHLLTALSHLLRRGVSIPDELSVICLSNDPVIERLSPLPCRYDPGPSLIKKLADSILTLANGESAASHLIIPKLIHGETLRRAPGRLLDF